MQVCQWIPIKEGEVGSISIGEVAPEREGVADEWETDMGEIEVFD